MLIYSFFGWQDFVSVGAIQLLAASLNVEFTFDVVNNKSLEEERNDENNQNGLIGQQLKS